MKAIYKLRRIRPCGCIWYGGSDPTFSCRDAAALQASYRFAEMLAAAMPRDWLCRRLVKITRSALDEHYRYAATVDIGPAVEDRAVGAS